MTRTYLILLHLLLLLRPKSSQISLTRIWMRSDMTTINPLFLCISWKTRNETWWGFCLDWLPPESFPWRHLEGWFYHRIKRKLPQLEGPASVFFSPDSKTSDSLAFPSSWFKSERFTWNQVLVGFRQKGRDWFLIEWSSHLCISFKNLKSKYQISPKLLCSAFNWQQMGNQMNLSALLSLMMWTAHVYLFVCRFVYLFGCLFGRSSPGWAWWGSSQRRASSQTLSHSLHQEELYYWQIWLACSEKFLFCTEMKISTAVSWHHNSLQICKCHPSKCLFLKAPQIQYYKDKYIKQS